MIAAGDVTSFYVSPNGQYVVFTADRDVDGETEIYSAKTDGTSTVQLNAAFSHGAADVKNVTSTITMSPDSLRVVYTADAQIDERIDAYIVNLDGTGFVRLNDPTTVGAAMDISGSPYFTPDGTKVIYMADEAVDEQVEAWSVDVDGTNKVRLNGVQVAGDVTAFHITPDSSKVVYRADHDTGAQFELWAVDVDGNNKTKLNGALAATWDFHIGTSASGTGTMQISNTEIIGQMADGNAPFDSDLYALPLNGAGEYLLHPVLGHNAQMGGYRFTPDFSKIFNRANYNTVGVIELFSVDADGNNHATVSGALVALGAVANYLISPDSSLVAAVGDLEADTIDELYVMPVAGGARTKLSSAIVANGDLPSSSNIPMAWRPNSSGVVFLGDLDTDEVRELYYAPADGSTRIKLNDTLPLGSAGFTSVFYDRWFEPIPDGSGVIYTIDEETATLPELYFVSYDGTTRRKLNTTLVTNGAVSGTGVHDVTFIVAENSDGVAYIADGDVDGKIELYWIGL